MFDMGASTQDHTRDHSRDHTRVAICMAHLTNVNLVRSEINCTQFGQKHLDSLFSAIQLRCEICPVKTAGNASLSGWSGSKISREFKFPIPVKYPGPSFTTMLLCCCCAKTSKRQRINTMMTAPPFSST